MGALEALILEPAMGQYNQATAPVPAQGGMGMQGGMQGGMQVGMQGGNAVRNHARIAAAQTMQNIPGNLLFEHRPCRTYKGNQVFSDRNKFAIITEAP